MHLVAFAHLVSEHGAGELGLELGADQAAQLARPELRPEPGRGEVRDRRLVDLKIHPLAVRGALHPLELQLDDGADLLAPQRMEDDDLVDAVDELGPEMAAHHVHDLPAQPRLVLLVDGAQAELALDQLRAEIARRDHDRVGEVDDPALAVGEPAVVEDLKQDVVDVRMRLLDLVEQHDANRAAAARAR